MGLVFLLRHSFTAHPHPLSSAFSSSSLSPSLWSLCELVCYRADNAAANLPSTCCVLLFDCETKHSYSKSSIARVPHTHTHMHTYMHMCMHAHVHAHTHIHTYAHVHTHKHTCTRTHIYMHTCTHTHAHVHAHDGSVKTSFSHWELLIHVFIMITSELKACLYIQMLNRRDQLTLKSTRKDFRPCSHSLLCGEETEAVPGGSFWK